MSHDADNLTTLRMTLVTEPLVILELSCDTPACAVRAIRLQVKDSDRTLLAQLTASGLSCPVCRQAAAIVDVRGFWQG